jgi:hypothetical protein
VAVDGRQARAANRDKPSLRGAFPVVNRPDATQKSRPSDVVVVLGRACRHSSSSDVQGRSASRWQRDTCLQRGTRMSSSRGGEKGDKRLEGWEAR